MYRDYPISAVFWSPINRSIVKIALFRNLFSIKIAIWEFQLSFSKFQVHFDLFIALFITNQNLKTKSMQQYQLRLYILLLCSVFCGTQSGAKPGPQFCTPPLTKVLPGNSSTMGDTWCSKMKHWYFVTKIVLTYCEKKLFH